MGRGENLTWRDLAFYGGTWEPLETMYPTTWKCWCCNCRHLSFFINKLLSSCFHSFLERKTHALNKKGRNSGFGSYIMIFLAKSIEKYVRIMKIFHCGIIKQYLFLLWFCTFDISLTASYEITLRPSVIHLSVRPSVSKLSQD